MWGQFSWPRLRVLEFVPNMLTPGIIVFVNTLLVIPSKLFLLSPVKRTLICLVKNAYTKHVSNILGKMEALNGRILEIGRVLDCITNIL
jgi:hypothetical protein